MKIRITAAVIGFEIGQIKDVKPAFGMRMIREEKAVAVEGPETIVDAEAAADIPAAPAAPKEPKAPKAPKTNNKK